MEEVTARDDDGLPQPNKSALSSLPPKKTENPDDAKKALTKGKQPAAAGGMASRRSSFSSSDAGSQLCIGDDRSGGDTFYYQLPIGDSSFDDDSSDLLSTSAYQYNSNSNDNHQQSAGQPTSSSVSTSKSRQRRRLANKPTSVRWVDSNQSFLSRDRFVKKYLSDSLLLSNSSSFNSNLSNNNSSSQRRVSFSSSASSSFRLNREPRQQPAGSLPASSCYVPVAKTPARAAALEHDILLSSSCSNSSLLADAALVDMARAAKKQLESVAKRRQVMVGKWKQRRAPNAQNSDSSVGVSDCQVYEYLTSDKDQYSVVAKVNLPCSLAEIQSVLASPGGASRGTEFHRSMVMLFGDQYVYGLNVRTVDSSSSAAALLRRSSASSMPSRRPTARSTASSSSADQQQTTGTARLAVNAVSLLMKRRLVWRPQNMSFLDFSDERPLAKSATRVLQTLDADSEDDEDDDDDENQHEPHNAGDPHRERRRARQSSALQLHESKRRARGLRGLLAGYVLQEDSEEQFTRLFFYANHKSVSAAASKAQSGVHKQQKSKKPVKVTSWSVQLIREMVSKLCTLESVVLRRRLGFYPLMDVPVASSTTYNSTTTNSNSPGCRSSCNSNNSDVALLQTPTGCCASCYVPFNALLFRKKHFCHLCGLFTCRKCSKVEPIEKVLGLIDRRRVCVSCVSRVNHYVFNLDGRSSDSHQLQQQELKGKTIAKLLFSGDTGKKLANVPEEDFPPLLGDDDDDDDLASTVLDDLALFPDEQLDNENDLAAENVATYLKKMFERGSSSMGRKNPFLSQQSQQQQSQQHGRFFGEIGGRGGEKTANNGDREATNASTPRESICMLLDSASASQSSLDEDESVGDGELPRRAAAAGGSAFA